MTKLAMSVCSQISLRANQAPNLLGVAIFKTNLLFCVDRDFSYAVMLFGPERPLRTSGFGRPCGAVSLLSHRLHVYVMSLPEVSSTPSFQMWSASIPHLLPIHVRTFLGKCTFILLFAYFTQLSTAYAHCSPFVSTPPVGPL